MPHIVQLDRHVADLIAAGEVVERPASAVKELVENAVDAGATQITVEVQNGGMTFLRVTDNGCGIAPEDAPTAFLRHATSKIRTKEDLAAIGTLGFRGEALAAISSVSRIDLLTKTAECDGVSLHLESGVVTSQQPAGCPQGTTILVRDLFFNTPARMKFMKSDSAESSAIAAVVQQQALAHPEISFRLIRDGETQMQTSGDGECLVAIYTVFGRELAKNMLAVNGTWEKFHVTGYITKPTATRGNRALQYFFLNGRFIRSRLLSAALEEAYRNQMMTGRFPACVLELQMPLEAVDVNVHPAKTEVKFLNERAVFDAVHYAALSTLSNASGRVAMQMPKSPAPDAQPAAPQQTARPAERPAARPAVNPNFYQTMQAGEYRRQAGAQPRTVLASQVQYPVRTPKPVEPAMPPVEKAPSPIAPPQPEPVVAPVKPAAKAEPEPAAIPKEPAPAPAEPEQLALDMPEQTFRLIGEAFDSYLIAEQGESVLFIDKHAAHERILFDKMRLNEKPLMPQELLEPQPFNTDPDGAALLEANAALLARLGFELDAFGDTAFLIRAVPAQLDAASAVPLLEELLEKLREGRSLSSSDVWERLAATVACKAAIKGGWVTEREELLALAEKVLAGEVTHCPHGRPVMTVFTRAELDKRFGRIV